MESKIESAIILLLFVLPLTLAAQQQVSVISRCGGIQVLQIPSISDNDHDGMDDELEQRLLDYFMPTIIQFDDETCPGPALDGTGDSNLVVCHMYPLPAQYVLSANLDSIKIHPVPIVSDTGLMTGMYWYQPLVMVRCALLYGKDCGLLGHTADVEGFSFSLQYTGPDTLAGWMYDTMMQHWMPVTIQTVSHAGTPCEQVETGPYKSSLAPSGFDTIYASPNKHGNYLTIAKCGSSIICNPGCNGIPSAKSVKIINLGEPDAALVNDLGNYYAAYSGEDPWGNADFLGGNAGTIKAKMLEVLSSDFVQGYKLNTANEICELYHQCFACGDSVYYACVASGDTVHPGTNGFSPVYDCKGISTGLEQPSVSAVLIYPVPASKRLHIVFPEKNETFKVTIYNNQGKQIMQFISGGSSALINISELPTGFYLLHLASRNYSILRKLVVKS